MGTFAALKYINAEQGRYAGSPAVAVIDAQASAQGVSVRQQPLSIASTNNNIIVLGENVSHFGVRARVAATTITTMPSVNIYRLYGPAESFASTTLANDGTIQFDVVNHSLTYSQSVGVLNYVETIQTFPFTATVGTTLVTNAKRDGTYLYSDWAIGDDSSFWQLDASSTQYSAGARQWLIPSYGARAVIVIHTVQANVSGGADTCDVLVYPFARGNNG